MSLNDKPNGRNSRLKIIVAIGLALILGVLMIDSEDKPTAEAEPVAAARRRRPRKKTAPDPMELLAARPTKPIERIPVGQILKYSPFDINGIVGAPAETSTAGGESGPGQPARRKQVEPAKPHPAIQELAGAKADIILESYKGRVARIGPRIVHEGANVVDGATVQVIDDRGALIQLQILPKAVRARRPRNLRR